MSDIIVDNYKDWYNRNMKIERIIEEKRKQIKQLELEIFTLNFTLEYWKQHPFKEG